MSESQSDNYRQPERLTFKGRTLPDLPASVRPDIDDYDGAFPPGGAMPANQYIDDETQQQQAEHNNALRSLYENPPIDMPQNFVRMVVDDYVINEVRRGLINFESFMAFTTECPDIIREMPDEIGLLMRGKASQDQIFDVVIQANVEAAAKKTKGYKTSEFWKLSHPYGYRMQHLEAIRENSTRSVVENGGIVYPEVLPYRDITITPNVEYGVPVYDDETDEVVGMNYHDTPILDGFIVRYKRDYGNVPIPGTDKMIHLVERQVAGIRVDEASGFSQAHLELFNQEAFKGVVPVEWNNPSDVRIPSRLEAYGIKNLIHTAIQTDSLEQYVVPLSTMMYGFVDNPQMSRVLGKSAKRLVDMNGLNSLIEALPMGEEIQEQK